jgi:hypothetical protein
MSGSQIKNAELFEQVLCLYYIIYMLFGTKFGTFSSHGFNCQLFILLENGVLLVNFLYKQFQ